MKYLLSLSVLIFSFAQQAQAVFNSSAPQCMELYSQVYNRDLPIFEQTTEYTCGPSVILSIKSKRGLLKGISSETDLAERMGTNSEVGTSPKQMTKGLSEFGFHSKSYETKDPLAFFSNLVKNHDYLLLINEDSEAHWVAISSYTNGFVYLMDPYKNQGALKKISRQELISKWQNVQFNKNSIYHFLVIEVL